MKLKDIKITEIGKTMAKIKKILESPDGSIVWSEDDKFTEIYELECLDEESAKQAVRQLINEFDCEQKGHCVLVYV